MLSDLIEKINNDAYEADETSFMTINVRPNEKIIGMLDVISHLNGKSQTSSMSKQFSQKIAEFLMSSKDNKEIINQIINSNLDHSGAVAILHAKHVIELDIQHFNITIE